MTWSGIPHGTSQDRLEAEICLEMDCGMTGMTYRPVYGVDEWGLDGRSAGICGFGIDRSGYDARMIFPLANQEVIRNEFASGGDQ